MIRKTSATIHTAFWFFTISIIILLVLSTLIKKGMFMDAMLYTAVSHNMSQGIGSFWFPFFDNYNVANLPSFHEQPPLVFGIQSIFFRLFGSSMYVERFYTFFTLCISAFIIKLLWDELSKVNIKLKPFAWLAILLWITIPVCFWSYSNNMHENTMGIFTLIAVLISYKALQSNESNYTYFILTGFFICLAVLSKGFPGFFPIMIPLLHWLFVRKKSFSKSVFYSAILLFVLIAVGFILYAYPDSNKSLSIYLFKRALQRINEVPSVDSRFFIFWRLLSELIPALILTAFIYFIARWKKIPPRFSFQSKQAFFFISVGLSGSLPLMLTMVQNGFYFVPALPFFAIGFAWLLAPILEPLFQKIQVKYYATFLRTSAVLLIGSLVFLFLQKDKYSRDKDLLHDINLIGSLLPKNTRIDCDDLTYQNWSLNCYLVRIFGMSISSTLIDSTKKEYYLTGIEMSDPDANFYKKIELNTRQYKIFKRH